MTPEEIDAITTKISNTFMASLIEMRNKLVDEVGAGPANTIVLNATTKTMSRIVANVIADMGGEGDDTVKKRVIAVEFFGKMGDLLAESVKKHAKGGTFGKVELNFKRFEA